MRPTDLIWRERTPFEAMTDRTAPSSHGLPTEVFRGFPHTVRQMPGDMRIASGIISLSPLSLAGNVTDLTLGAGSLWLETRTRADDTTTLA